MQRHFRSPGAGERELLRIAGVVLVAILTLTVPSPAQAIDYIWNNPAGGSWNAAANWTPNGVPDDYTDTATIALAGTYTVTVDSGVGPRSVTVGGASGTQTLSLLAQVTLWSTSQCSFTVNSNGVLALSGAGGLRLSNPIVPPTTLANQGVIDLQSDVQITSEGANLVANAGLVKKSGGSGTALILVNSVTNTGTFDVQAGTLSLLSNFGTMQSTGAGNTLSAQPGTTLAIAGFANGANVFAGTTFGGPGAKTLELSATLSGTIGMTNTRLVNGVFRGAFTLNGTLDWHGGFLGGDADFAMTIPAGANLVIGGTSYKSVRSTGAFTTLITNSGTITFAGPSGFQSLGTPSIVNTAGGLIDFTSDTGIQSGGNLALANAGTLRKSAGTGVSGLYAVALTNAGTIRVQAGTLSIEGTFLQTAGRTELAGGDLVTPAFSTAQFIGGVLAGTGTVTGNVQVSDAAQTRPGTSPGQITVAGPYTQTGNLIVELNGTTPGTQYDQLVAQGAVTVGGTLTVSLGFVPAVGTEFRIIDNTGPGAVAGAFSGLPQSAILTVNGVQLQISYVGGTGNDVTLTVVQNTGLICTPFTDVDQASPFCPNVQWMKNRGVTIGCTPTLYCPAQDTTRLQMAVFMNRLGNVLSGAPRMLEFTSVAIPGGPADVVCGGDHEGANYERHVTLDAVLMGQGDGNVEYTVEPVASVDGTNWIALAPPIPFSVFGSRWVNVRVSGDRYVAPNEVVQFGLRLTRTAGVGFWDARCAMRLVIGNQVTGTPP